MESSPLPTWLLELLSVDVERLRGGSAHLRLARFPEGGLAFLLVLALLGAVGFVAWNYRLEGQTARWKKCLLAVLRCLIVLLAALILCYPVLEVDRKQELRATTLVLLDESASISIKDNYVADTPRREALARSLALSSDEVGRLGRGELVARALAPREGARSPLEQLAEKNQLKVHTFSGLPLEPFAAGPGKESALLERLRAPRGPITDLSGALRSAVEEEGAGKVAGIVVVTDGRVTAGEDLKSVGAFLAARGVPVHAVGVGDPTPARNLRLGALLASERVFQGDPVVVDARLEHQGFGGETVRVELTDSFEAPGEAPRAEVKVETIEVPLLDTRADAAVGFRFEPSGIGKHRLTARIEPRPEEAFQDDNTRTVIVEVVKDASRVLLIAGAPSYEYRFLKNLLRRDSRISVASWLMSADPEYPQEGDVSLKKLPATAKELFDFDVVILMDPDPLGFPEGFGALLEELVGKRRGGVVFSAGEKYATVFHESPALEAIRGMLPVVISAGDVREETGRGRFYERLWPLIPTPQAQAHAATRLSSQVDRNRDRWAEIAGIYWSFPARKAKPGATVLFVHPDPALARDGEPRPLVAFQYYEGGRVMWVGIDSTWRWRATAEEVYDRFWIQSLRYLTESRLAGNRRKLLECDREVYDLGDTLRVSLYRTDESFRPVVAPEATVLVNAPDEAPQEITLLQDPAAPGWFRGTYIPRKVGEHVVRSPDSGDGSTAEKTVRVEPPAVEFETPRLDEEALRELATATSGSYVPLAEIASVPGRIPDRRQTLVTTDEPIPLWDNALFLGALTALFTAEWILRKLWRLL